MVLEAQRLKGNMPKKKKKKKKEKKNGSWMGSVVASCGGAAGFSQLKSTSSESGTETKPGPRSGGVRERFRKQINPGGTERE